MQMIEKHSKSGEEILGLLYANQKPINMMEDGLGQLFLLPDQLITGFYEERRAVAGEGRIDGGFSLFIPLAAASTVPHPQLPGKLTRAENWEWG